MTSVDAIRIPNFTKWEILGNQFIPPKKKYLVLSGAGGGAPQKKKEATPPFQESKSFKLQIRGWRGGGGDT